MENPAAAEYSTRRQRAHILGVASRLVVGLSSSNPERKQGNLIHIMQKEKYSEEDGLCTRPSARIQSAEINFNVLNL